ncbi:MAG: hypothetical protein KatS3mg035_0744 [Bacteroidia bacterium]|nr:MAG: hypothetical protein KatS3mg035_0744 [Bacteroidia bacterium]
MISIVLLYLQKFSYDMKKYILALSVAGLFFFTNCTKAPDAQKADTKDAQEVKTTSGKELKVDTQNSLVKWIGTKRTGRHEGTVKIQEGVLKVQDGNLTGGSFVLNMNTIEVTDLKPGEGKEKLEGHLKADDFFNVEKYPTAKFEITSVTPDTTGGNTHKIEGNLTIRETTKSITFGAKVNISEDAVEATTNFNINRKDWGIQYEGKKDDLIRDEVNFNIQIKTEKSS